MLKPHLSHAACLALALAGCAHDQTMHIDNPPETAVHPVTDTMHGESIVDDYRWLEGSQDPEHMGQVTPEVKDWTAKQNAYTRSVLDQLPGREALTQRIGELMRVDSIGRPRMVEGFYFNTERKGDQKQPVLYLRTGHDGDKRELLNVNTIDPSGLTALAWYTPSPDGSLLAYGTYHAGDENATLHLMDVATGQLHTDTIEGKVGGVQWLPDGQSFVYSKLADVNNPYSAQIKYHTLGADPADDRLIFEQYKEGPLATTWGPFHDLSRDGKWLALGYHTSTSSNDLWLIDFQHWLKTGGLVKQDLMVDANANTNPFFAHGKLYLSTQVDAPNGAVWMLDPASPARENWQLVIPESKDRVVGSLSEAKDMLVVGFEHKAHDIFVCYQPDGTEIAELPLPGSGLGSAGLTTAHDRTEAYLGYTSYNEPTSIYRLDLAQAVQQDQADYALWARPDVPVDPSQIDVEQVTYTSKDGTPVTMFLVHKKGIEKTGDNPTLLYGYGGFGISMNPGFNPTLFPFLEAGGVYAVANLRGGGEYGDAWHKAGTLGNKQNVFDDFYAAAEWLIAEGYTNSDKLAIAGGSNGGLLVGAAVTQRPDLYKAAICGVPLLDMLRYQHFLMARYWVPEYGDPQNPEHFKWLKAYSPYQHIEPGTDYPAILVTAGENDTRVHALHARKFAAKLQADTSAAPQDAPVMVWVDQEGGHGQGKPLDLRIRDIVDQRGFIMWQLGMTPPAPGK